VLSATFHWHVIRNGALLVGEESHSLADDLKRIPALIGSYFAWPVVVTRRVANGLVAKGDPYVAFGAGD
jgi:hypothetical protein